MLALSATIYLSVALRVVGDHPYRCRGPTESIANPLWHMATQTQQLAYVPLTAHAYNADRSQVAVCANTNEVQIYDTRNWQIHSNLSEHDKLVTSIDWEPRTNQIVTCAQDRNAYVWNLSSDPQTGVTSWKPTLVLLRLNRSATCVRWSPDGRKFAVGSGARAIAICSYDDESNWWVARHLKKPLRSTILDLDWHPNSILLAAGSADSQARVFSAFLKGDPKPPASVWGTKLPFNTVCGEFESGSGGWINAVAFSPGGDVLAFAAHDATITVVYPAGEGLPPTALYSVRSHALPYMALLFTTETALIAAGHDCEPVLLEGNATAGWHISRSLDDPAARSSAAGGAGRGGGAAAGRLNSEAFRTFRAADSRGVSGAAVAAAGPPTGQTGSPGLVRTAAGSERVTIHQNTITSLRKYSGQPGAVSAVSTSGADGRLVVWNVGGVAGVTGGIARMGMR